ncbi:MAG: ribosome silencing factor [Paludibacteraceae bacterium]|nr:ribosome silencing factor [Paludibacteraceae bacterium]
MATEELLSAIVAGLQELKAKKIVLINLKEVCSECDYFVVCEGNSSTHTSSIALESKNFVLKNAKTKHFAIDGEDNGIWIAMDYGEIIVHVFQHEAREFYDIEHLWGDAKLTEIQDID